MPNKELFTEHGGTPGTESPSHFEQHSFGTGTVTTLVTACELPRLLEMAAELGIALDKVPEPPASDPAAEGGASLESVKQDLDELFQLFEAPGSEEGEQAGGDDD